VQIYLKRENLLLTNSFKLRGAFNAVRCLKPSQLQDGVYSTSSGNFGLGLAWAAAQTLHVPCHILLRDSAPQSKFTAIQRLGADITRVTAETCLSIMMAHHYAGIKGHFIHPECNRDVIAGE